MGRNAALHEWTGPRRPLPQNRGTVACFLLPLLSIVRRDPDNQVTLLPSDSCVRADVAGLAALTVRARARATS